MASFTARTRSRIRVSASTSSMYRARDSVSRPCFQRLQLGSERRGRRARSESAFQFAVSRSVVAIRLAQRFVAPEVDDDVVQRRRRRLGRRRRGRRTRLAAGAASAACTDGAAHAIASANSAARTPQPSAAAMSVGAGMHRRIGREPGGGRQCGTDNEGPHRRDRSLASSRRRGARDWSSGPRGAKLAALRPGRHGSRISLRSIRSQCVGSLRDGGARVACHRRARRACRRDRAAGRADHPQQPAPDTGGHRHRGHAAQGRARSAEASRRDVFRVSRHRANADGGIRRRASGIPAAQIRRAQHPRDRCGGAGRGQVRGRVARPHAPRGAGGTHRPAQGSIAADGAAARRRRQGGRPRRVGGGDARSRAAICSPTPGSS